MMEITKIRHGKLRVKSHGDALRELWRGGNQDDVVEIEKRVGNIVILFVNKEGCVGCQC
jgi:hypothetical protein